MKSLLPFWALNIVVTLLLMEGQRALKFPQKYLNFCSEDEQGLVLQVWNDMRVRIRQNFHFLVN